MEKSSRKKKIAILIIALIGIILLLPFLSYLRMRINILRNMQKVYKNADFVHFSCDSKPVPEDHFKHYRWYGGEEPDVPLYAFIIEDSEGNPGWGYATKDGKVMLDNYAGTYYLQDTIDYFERIVDFKNNFPELEYTMVHSSPENLRRLVYTEDCSSFEGYMKARLIGTSSITNWGYSGIGVGLNTRDHQYVYDINQILRNADFEVYVEYFTIDERITDEKLKGIGFELGKYFPFGTDNYDTAVLGDTTEYEHLKEKNGTLFTIDILKKGSPSVSYTLNFDGTLIKNDHEHGSEEKCEISDDNYITINRFGWGKKYDIERPITSGSEDSDRHIKVYLHNHWTRDDGKEMYFDYSLYDVDEPDDSLGPILELVEGYF
jgi:hypothetical protein